MLISGKLNFRPKKINDCIMIKGLTHIEILGICASKTKLQNMYSKTEN